MSSNQRSIDISYVTYLKPSGPQNRNVRFQEDDKEWGFTNKGMVELPVHTVNQNTAPENGSSPQKGIDMRLKTILEKGDWHRARNTDLRWNRASAFSVSRGQSKHLSLNYQPNQSAYEVMLRNRSTISEVTRRPVTTIQPTNLEVKPRLSSNDLSGRTPKSPIKTDMPMAFRSDVTIPPDSVLSVSSAPINNSHSIHSIRYMEDSKSKRRRTRLRPKTASAANLQPLIEPSNHWTLRRLNSEYELRKAYTTVTGEKVLAGKNFGLRDSCLTSFYTEEATQRVVKIRALKSAPLSPLLKRRKVPTSYTIAEDSVQLQPETDAPVKQEADYVKNSEEKNEMQPDDHRRNLKTR